MHYFNTSVKCSICKEFFLIVSKPLHLNKSKTKVEAPSDQNWLTKCTALDQKISSSEGSKTSRFDKNFFKTLTNSRDVEVAFDGSKSCLYGARSRIELSLLSGFNRKYSC